MDEYEDQQLQMMKLHQAVCNIGKYHRIRSYHKFLKNTLHLVASLALLSFFLCYFSLFPNSFSVYFSTFLFSFFTHTLDRKYMFLICNGILAFLAKISLSTTTSSPSDIISAPILTSSSTNLTPTKADEVVYVDYHDHAPDHLVVVEDDQEEYKGEGVQEAAANGGHEEVQSTEELNRKIEEFIRRMKEEIRIEAQQQLVAAV